MATAGWIRRARGGRNAPGGRDAEGAPAEGVRLVGLSDTGALSATATGHSSRAALPLVVASVVAAAAAAAAAAVAVAVPAGTAGASQAAGSRSHVQTVHLSSGKVPHVGTVLTTAGGLTLYRFTANPPGMSTCTGSCADVWPPLLAVKGDRVAGPRGVKGLSVIDVGRGRWQVAFHDVVLYRFEGDTKRGQAKGQGIAHEWFAVLKSGIPAVTPGAAGAAAITTTPTTAAGMTTTTKAPQSVTTSPPATTPTPVTQAPVPVPTTTPTTVPPPPPPPTTATTQPPTTTTLGGGYGY